MNKIKKVALVSVYGADLNIAKTRIPVFSESDKNDAIMRLKKYQKSDPEQALIEDEISIWGQQDLINEISNELGKSLA